MGPDETRTGAEALEIRRQLQREYDADERTFRRMIPLTM